MDLIPNVNDPVVLRVHADREYRSRVDNLGAGLLVVTQPHDLPADEAFVTGMDVSVAWTDSDGDTTVLPTRILATHDDGTVPLWSLVVTGPASRAQRRRFDRVPASGEVALRSPAGGETDPVPGSLVEVSERAVRCAVEAGAADGFLGGHSEVIAEFRFGTVDFAVPGRVEFLRPTRHPADLEELVVLFDEPVADAAALRKQVAKEMRALPAQGDGDQEADSPAHP